MITTNDLGPRTVCRLHIFTECTGQPDLFHRTTVDIEQFGAGYQDDGAPGSRGGDIQSIQAVEKVHSPRYVFRQRQDLTEKPSEMHSDGALCGLTSRNSELFKMNRKAVSVFRDCVGQCKSSFRYSDYFLKQFWIVSMI